MERRNFIIRGTRWILAGGLAGMTGFLLYRRKVGDPSDCFINPFCQRCRQNASCGIVAEAKDTKNEEREEEKGPGH